MHPNIIEHTYFSSRYLLCQQVYSDDYTSRLDLTEYQKSQIRDGIVDFVKDVKKMRMSGRLDFEKEFADKILNLLEVIDPIT